MFGDNEDYGSDALHTYKEVLCMLSSFLFYCMPLTVHTHGVLLNLCLFMVHIHAAFPDSCPVQEDREPAQGSGLPEGVPDTAG